MDFSFFLEQGEGGVDVGRKIREVATSCVCLFYMVVLSLGPAIIWDLHPHRFTYLFLSFSLFLILLLPCSKIFWSCVFNTKSPFQIYTFLAVIRVVDAFAHSGHPKCI